MSDQQQPPPQPPGHGSDQPPAPGYWRASDGNWYPPQQSQPSGTGGDQPPAPGYWRASDGNWYPPEQHPNAAPPAPPVPAPSYSPPAAPGAAWGTQAPPGAPPAGYGAPPHGTGYQGSPPPGGKKSNKGLWIALAVVLLVIVGGVWGCLALLSAGTEAVVDGAADAVGEIADEVEQEMNENEATAEGGGEAGSETDPLPLGTEADLGNGWRVKVDSANLDATADVLAANEFNQEPDEGMRYVVVNLTMSFDGDGDKQREAPLFGVDLSLYGSDRVERSDGVIGASLDNGVDSLSEIAAGGVATGSAVFEVGAAETDLVLLATPSLSFDSTEAWFALG